MDMSEAGDGRGDLAFQGGQYWGLLGNKGMSYIGIIREVQGLYGGHGDNAVTVICNFVGCLRGVRDFPLCRVDLVSNRCWEVLH